MVEKQKTIAKSFSINGIGLHTGCRATLTFHPAGENCGIHFIRTDLPGKPVIKVEPANVLLESGVPRCTSLGSGEAVVHTVEHLLSALYGTGIINVDIDINAEEVPGLDGSGAAFLKAVEECGVVEQAAEVEPFVIKEPVGVEHEGSSIYIVPSDRLEISYALHYDHPHLNSQYFRSFMDKEIFKKDIAPCRTFCLESEAKELKEKGLGKGASYDNTLVIGEKGVIDNKLLFDDECTRHKVLDFIGDLYLLGVPICGRVYAVRSGHRLNRRLLLKIAEQKKRFEQRNDPQEYITGGQKEINIDGIMKILPHRYPFLLVDRVIEIEKGVKGVGIKNVTINDNFFQGHFPRRPIMPGVLMVEAMAQTAGVVILTNEAHRGKVAFFLAADQVKFRKVVTPGDQLVMEVEVVRDRPKSVKVKAQAKVSQQVVAEADMVFSFIESAYLD